MSERRACTLVAADRKMIRYRSRRPPDIELRSRLRDLANQRRRFGYRRLFILLREQGEPRQLPDNSIGFSTAEMKIVADAVAAERWERDNDQNRRPTQWDAALEWLVKQVNYDEPGIL